MCFLLVTVTEGSPQSQTNLAALVGSLAGQPAHAHLIVVMRGGGTFSGTIPENLVIHRVERPLATSLSRARNSALAYARDQGLMDRVDLVGFPDDDCTYPTGLLGEVRCRIAADVDVVCGPYGPSRSEIDWQRFPVMPQPITPSLVMRAVSSATVFFAARVVTVVGDFDERFGLGADLGASEDADYVLRALEAGFVGRYSPDAVFVEHPYKSSRAPQYYLGNVAVLAKHARAHRRLPLSLVHRVLAGTQLVLRGELSVSEYSRAIAAAASLVCDSRQVR